MFGRGIGWRFGLGARAWIPVEGNGRNGAVEGMIPSVLVVCLGRAPSAKGLFLFQLDSGSLSVPVCVDNKQEHCAWVPRYIGT